MKKRIRLASVPGIGVCDDAMIGCSGEEKKYRICIAKPAAILAGFLLAMESVAPLGADYIEPDMLDYSTNKILEPKVRMDKRSDLIFHSEVFAGGKESVSLFESKAKIEEWKENTEIPMLTEIAVQVPIVEDTEEETVPENMYGHTTEVWISETVMPDEGVMVPGSADISDMPGDIVIPENDGTEESPEDIIVPDTDYAGDTGSDTILSGDGMKEENETKDTIVPEAGDAAEDVPALGDDKIEEGSVTDGTAADEPVHGDTITEDGGTTEEITETPDTPAGFLIDGEGMICGIGDTVLAAANGYLELPSEGCVGIRSGALEGIGTGIAEIYIPANISIIEEGAFSGLCSLGWIEAAEGNPGCMSIDGVLFDGNGTMLLAFPGGRTDTYVVPAEVTRIASGAFKDTVISRLDFWLCGEIGLGENIFGTHNGNGIEVRVPEENISWYQEVFAGYDVMIL